MYKRSFKNVEELFKIMEDIVNQEVKHYQSDLQYDVDRIKKDVSKNKQYQYLWMTRKCGTCLLRKDKLEYRCTDDWQLLHYYMKYAEFESIYLIDIKEKSIQQLSGIEIIRIHENAKTAMPKEIAQKLINEFIEEYENELKKEDLEHNIQRLKRMYKIA